MRKPLFLLYFLWKVNLDLSILNYLPLFQGSNHCLNSKWLFVIVQWQTEGQEPYTFIQQVTKLLEHFFTVSKRNPHFWLINYSLKFLWIKNVYSCTFSYFWSWGLLLIKHRHLLPRGKANWSPGMDVTGPGSCSLPGS